jgi:hypothetical protein
MQMDFDVTSISAIVAAAGVLIGVVYYILDMRNQNKVRQTDLIMRLYSVFGTSEFAESFQEVLGIESKEIDYLVKSTDDVSNKVKLAVRTQAIFFEGLGILLYRGLVDTGLAYDLFSANIILTWQKLEPIFKKMRERWKHPQMWEWFEYLYKEMKKKEQKLQK